jgi:hypothetical protein
MDRRGSGWNKFPHPILSDVNDMSTPSHLVDLALYTDQTAITATSRQPALLVSYLKAYLSDLEWWLRELSITINDALR